MTSSNPHLRGIAIAGVLAIAAVGLGMMTLSRQQPSSEAATTASLVHHHRAPAIVPVSAARAKAKVTPKPKPKPKPLDTIFAKAALAAGLPKPVAVAFADHEVAVVTLYSPHADVDEAAQAEARAGAALAGAGYVRVDASTDGTTGLLTKAYGVLSAPTTLVLTRADFTRPFMSLAGFADRETVAQAAINADPTPGEAGAKTAWARQAQALCGRARRQLDGVASGTAQVKTIGDTLVTALGKLAPPAGQEVDVQKFVTLAQQHLSLELQLATATASNDHIVMATATASASTVGAQANALAATLGAPDCANAV